MYARKNEEAVSQVIGVILMVAVTVILSAVIASFVFGMSNNIQKTKVVAVTGQRIDASHVLFTNYGGQDAATLSSVALTTSTNSTIGWLNATSGSLPVGATITKPAGNTEVITAVGYFTDGTSQVLSSGTI